ncbi:NMDA receptor synaptonuclear signaling and neuronal migration factor-like [Scleropages formosus]|uniref:NMDA receptor synaptonuclear signaling and neuronal migration factor-like n=1 Tax=Scleropages formosus TaxID=113540 RepID=A0A0N8JZ39_SCLFO|nr:NMDA receptor synaptonuclear signaling and neuronal migration factor-like [Scleropages formosus]
MKASFNRYCSSRWDLRAAHVTLRRARDRERSAARAFGEYLSQSHPENCNGSDHLLSDSFAGQDSDSADNSCPHSNNLRLRPSSPPAVAVSTGTTGLSSSQPSLPPPPPPKRRLSLEHSFTAEEERQKCCECALQPARVYTITGERGMLGARGSKENLELEVLKAGRDQVPSQPPSTSSSPPSHHHHHANHHHANNHQGGGAAQPLQSSVSAHNIRGWGDGKGGCREDCTLGCEACSGAPSHSQRSLDLESSHRDAGKQSATVDRMGSVHRVTGLAREDGGNSWFPKENMFSFQTATTTMQAAFRGFAERKRRKRELESAAKFPEAPTDGGQQESGDLQTSCGTLDDGVCNDLDWEEEREMERVACEGDDFIPPKIMLISSKVPKAEYVPTIIRRDDPSIIPILYDHEHATFDDILEEIEKKLTAYRRGCKIWRMLLFWRRLSRLMSKLNPEPNLIHIMGCYVLGNPNGEKLFQKLKNLMRPYSVAFESPLELSAQGKEMIETYFDFRLFRLWKTRQHSKLLDYDDLFPPLLQHLCLYCSQWGGWSTVKVLVVVKTVKSQWTSGLAALGDWRGGRGVK